MPDQMERLPPQNLDAEQSLLGSMLLSREAVYEAVEILDQSAFYRTAHSRIFEAIVHLVEAGEGADIVTVAEELRRRGQLEETGGVDYLTQLANAVPSAANAAYYARIVEDKAVLRRLIHAAAEITQKAYEGADEVADLLDEAERLFFLIGQGRRIQGYSALKDVLVETFDRIQYLQSHKGEVIGVPSGFRDLDNMTTGFHPSELIILAARPSQGKTALSLNMAVHAATHGVPVGIFSLEMSRDQLAQRLLSSHSHVDSHRLRTGHLTEEDWQRISRGLVTLSEAPIYIDDTPNLSVMELRSRARRMKAEHDIQFLVVDYLQLMHTRGRAESRQQEISEISRSLKALARELEVPVLALSQLSRAVEQRTDRRPQLSDLRESGAIEQDADMVAFIYHNPDTQDANIVELVLAKQRNGPTGSVQLVFLKQFGKFVNLDRQHREAG